MGWYARSPRTVLGGLVVVFSLGFQNPSPAGFSESYLRLETGSHNATIWRVAVDPKAQFVVTASDDKTARVWNIKDGSLRLILRPPQGAGTSGKLYAVAVSPRDNVIAVGGLTRLVSQDTHSIYLFEASTGRLLRRIPGLPNVVHHLSWSYSGDYLAAALGSSGIRVYRSSDYGQVGQDDSYGDASDWVEFSSSGRLVSSSLDGYLRLYGADFKVLKKVLAPGGREPYAVRFSRDWTRIAVGYSDVARVDVVSASDLSLLYTPATTGISGGSLNQVEWSLDGQTLFAAGDYAVADKQEGRPRWSFPILAWSDSGRGPRRSVTSFTNTIRALQALPSGGLVAVDSDPSLAVMDSKSITLWEKGSLTLDFLLARQPILTVSNDAKVVEFNRDNYDPATGKVVQDLTRFSIADRSLFTAARGDATLASPRTIGIPVQNWKDGLSPSLFGKTLPITKGERSRCLAITPNQDAFVLGTDYRLHLFGRAGALLWTTSTETSPLVVNVSGDARHVVALFNDGVVRWYSLTNGELELSLFVPRDARTWVAWTNEGFYDNAIKGDQLVGYHLNQGVSTAGEFVAASQLRDLFFQPDLVKTRLDPIGQPHSVATRKNIGDIRQVLSGGLPPAVELLSSRESESEGDFVLSLRFTDRGGGVGRVVYYVDGQEIDGRPVDIFTVVANTVSRRFTLAGGRHTVSAAVYNEKNQLEARSPDAVVHVRSKEQASTLHVLAAGVTNYRNPTLAKGVRFAANDAKAVAAQFTQSAKGLFTAVNPVTLIDSQATLAGIKKTIEDLATKARVNDVVILYFAGHGAAYEGNYSFVPWEVQPGTAESVLKQTLNHATLQELLRKVPAQKVLLLLDTCSSGAFEFGSSADAQQASAVRFGRITGRAILAAAGSTQMALEGYQGHGVFTYALLKGLLVDPDKNGHVEVSELIDYVQKEVPRITTERWGVVQRPVQEVKGQTFAIARLR